MIRSTAMIAALLLAGCAEPVTPTRIAIEHVTVIDPIDGPLADRRVLIEGERILSVSGMAAAPESAADVVDGRGKYLIPGLWDMHVHFLYDRALTERMADLFLDYGITSVRDTGGDVAALVALREKLRASTTPAPRVFLSGPLLDGRFVVYDGADPGQPRLGVQVADAHAARERVRALAAAGVDFVKIYELVEPDVFEAIVAEARRLELPIAAHVPLMMTADSAGPSVDSMEHLRNIELACASNWRELLAERQARMIRFIEGRGFELRRDLHTLQRVPAIAAYDAGRCAQVLDTLRETIQVPTLRLNTVNTRPPIARPDWTGALEALPESTRLEWRARAEAILDAAPQTDPAFSQWSLELVALMKARGVPIGAGTDTPIGLGIPGYSLHTELELLVEAGLTPLEALHAATVQPARFIGLQHASGQIRDGMRADLVLLEADPLEDIRNTRRIARVMAGGAWVR